MIKMGYDNKQFKLINKDTGIEVNEGDDIVSFRGVATKVNYVQAPHKPSSSGKVNGYYASVYNLKWEEIQ
jgi:hypothetical protein